jgi:hypothetical protein
VRAEEVGRAKRDDDEEGIRYKYITCIYRNVIMKPIILYNK